MRKLVAFDLDGTLAESKSPVDEEMARLLASLLEVAPAAVISGGDWPQFESQLLSRLIPGARLGALSLLPACGTKFYRHASGAWERLYAEDFSPEDKKRVTEAIERAVRDCGLPAERTWGERIEDRGSQITFSALGQRAPLAAKRAWDPDFAKRRALSELLRESLPGFAVSMGGATSVDVTRAGVDKGYGLRKLTEVLGTPVTEMIFVGDALFPGGNDHPARLAGAASIQVRDPGETKRVIEAIVACLQDRGAGTPRAS